MTREKLKALADGDCPDCYGEGLVSICWNNDPGRCQEVACDCTAREKEPSFYCDGCGQHVGMNGCGCDG